MNLDGLRPWGGLVGGSPPDVVVAGIAYDGSAVYRKGAALAPQRIRQLSAAMPPVTEEGHLLTGLRVQDIGDLDAGGDIETGWGAPEPRLVQVPPESVLTVARRAPMAPVPTLAAAVRAQPGPAF